MLGGVVLFGMHVCIFMAWWSGLHDGSGPFTFGVLGALTLYVLMFDCWLSHEIIRAPRPQREGEGMSVLGKQTGRPPAAPSGGERGRGEVSDEKPAQREERWTLHVDPENPRVPVVCSGKGVCWYCYAPSDHALKVLVEVVPAALLDAEREKVRVYRDYFVHLKTHFCAGQSCGVEAELWDNCEESLKP